MSGFTYIAADTNRYQDIRIKRLKNEFQGNGVSVYDYILTEIYRVKGCFLVWDESTVFDVSDYWKLKESTVCEIVNYCCHVGLFNKGLLASEGILTSESIQRRFMYWSEKAKRKNVIIPELYLLLPEYSAKVPEDLPDIPEDSDNYTEQNSKEQNKTIPATPFDAIFKSFLEMRKKMKKPATDYAIHLIHSKLDKLSDGDIDLKIKILEQSIRCNWQDVFELKTEKQTTNAKRGFIP